MSKQSNTREQDELVDVDFDDDDLDDDDWDDDELEDFEFDWDDEL